MKRKGFIRVVEAVVASVIVLASLSYFFGYYIKPSEWTNAQIKIQSQDVLNVIDLNRLVDNYMKDGIVDELKNGIQNMVSERIGFAVDIIGAAPPVVRIACVNCGEQDGGMDEVAALRNRTDPFSDPVNYKDYPMRGRKVRFAIINASLSIGDVNTDDFDLVFIYGYPAGGFADAEKDSMESYLEGGGNVILFSSLTAEQINDQFLQDFFGLAARSGSNTNSQFYNADVAGTASSKIYYYYYNISNGAGYDLSLDTGNVDADDKTITKNGNNAAVKVNLSGNGRVVWFNYYSKEHATMNNGDTNGLLKSVILWAAEDFEAIPEPAFTLTLPKTYFKTSYVVSAVGNVFDMYKIDLTTWFIY